MLAHPVRLLDMCPQSDGAAAIVVASGNAAWRHLAGNRHGVHAASPPRSAFTSVTSTGAWSPCGPCEMQRAVYSPEAAITRPLADIDVAEIYEPVTYAGAAWYEALGFCEDGNAGRLIEEGVTGMDGELPVNPSGGVLSTNPVGASGVIRVAGISAQPDGTRRKPPGARGADCARHRLRRTPE